MIQHRGAKACFNDLCISRHDGADPAHVSFVRPDRSTTRDNAGIGGVVGNGVVNVSGCARFRIGSQDTGIENL